MPPSISGSSTTTEIALFTEQLWNKTEDWLTHDSESCSWKPLPKVLEMDGAVQERNRNEAKAADKMQQDSQVPKTTGT